MESELARKIDELATLVAQDAEAFDLVARYDQVVKRLANKVYDAWKQKRGTEPTFII